MVCRPYAQWFYKLVFRCFLNTLCTDYGIFRTENGGVFHFQPLFGIIPNVIYTVASSALGAQVILSAALPDYPKDK